MKKYAALSEERRLQFLNDPYFENSRKWLNENAEKMLATEPPRVLFSQIHLYAETGNREVFERVYGTYQTRMRIFFFKVWLENDESYLTPLADAIWNVCDLESWSIPAHVREELPEEMRWKNLDLCSTILASELAMILYYVGDKLPALVVKRAKYELRTRLIDSYRDATPKDYWWMKVTNNWSAVCIASVLVTYLFAAEREEIEAQLPRMIDTAECYLKGFTDEGCCSEGYGYWVYGFSYFCIFADMLRDYTDGAIDYFKNEKVHAIAKFQQNVSINERETVCFSDCDPIFRPNTTLSHFLKNEYDDVEIPALGVGGFGKITDLFWVDPTLADCKMRPKSHIYHDAQWFIHRSEAYNFACKAGSNSESHNHNDVGTFMISKNGKATFADPGVGEYTRQYFGPERYTIVACAGRGHSLPIINGESEAAGGEKSTVFEESGNRYSFSMENAYRVEILKSLKRSFSCEKDGVTMTDSFVFSEKPETLKERFVSLTAPKDLGGGRVAIGDSILCYDENLFSLSFSDELLGRKGGTKDPVYYTDLVVKEPKTECEYSFRMI